MIRNDAKPLGYRRFVTINDLIDDYAKEKLTPLFNAETDITKEMLIAKFGYGEKKALAEMDKLVKQYGGEKLKVRLANGKIAWAYRATICVIDSDEVGQGK